MDSSKAVGVDLKPGPDLSPQHQLSNDNNQSGHLHKPWSQAGRTDGLDWPTTRDEAKRVHISFAVLYMLDIDQYRCVCTFGRSPPIYPA